MSRVDEVVPSRRKRQRNSKELPGCSGPGPSRCREVRDHSRPAKRKRRLPLHLPEELSRAPLIVSSSGQLDQDSRSISQSEDEDESVLEVGRAGPPLSSRLTSRPISLDSSDTEGNREEASRGRSGTSPVGGAVVDLTNDSGVEDEDIVDLTSPIRVQLPPIVPEHEFLHERPSCRYAGSHDSGGGRTTMTRSTVIRRPPSTPDVVIVQESDDEVQVINTPSGSLRRSKRPQPTPPPPRSTKSALTCPICMDTAQQFETSGRQLVTTVCGHIFCNTCIRNAIQRQHKCPTCRKKLTLKQYHPLFL